jgi:hypothetical protein
MSDRLSPLAVSLPAGGRSIRAMTTAPDSELARRISICSTSWRPTSSSNAKA